MAANDIESGGSEQNPYHKDGVISADEQYWIRERLLTLTRITRAAEAERRVGADERIAEDAIEGAVNGTAVEIANTLGLKVEGDNYRRPWRVSGNRDEHLRYQDTDS